MHTFTYRWDEGWGGAWRGGEGRGGRSYWCEMGRERTLLSSHTGLFTPSERGCWSHSLLAISHGYGGNRLEPVPQTSTPSGGAGHEVNSLSSNIGRMISQKYWRAWRLILWHWEGGAVRHTSYWEGGGGGWDIHHTGREGGGGCETHIILGGRGGGAVRYTSYREGDCETYTSYWEGGGGCETYIIPGGRGLWDIHHTGRGTVRHTSYWEGEGLWDIHHTGRGTVRHTSYWEGGGAVRHTSYREGGGLWAIHHTGREGDCEPYIILGGRGLWNIHHTGREGGLWNIHHTRREGLWDIHHTGREGAVKHTSY